MVKGNYGLYPVTKIRMRSVLLVKPIFPLHYHAQVLVIQNETLDI